MVCVKVVRRGVQVIAKGGEKVVRRGVQDKGVQRLVHRGCGGGTSFASSHMSHRKNSTASLYLEDQCIRWKNDYLTVVFSVVKHSCIRFIQFFKVFFQLSKSYQRSKSLISF